MGVCASTIRGECSRIGMMRLKCVWRDRGGLLGVAVGLLRPHEVSGIARVSSVAIMQCVL